MDKKHSPDRDYRQILLETRKSVLTGLGAKAQALAHGDRISDEDQAQHSLQEAVSLRINGFEYLQLRQIQEALDRLQLGEYGICLSCDCAIAPKRLKALPWARYCVACQERMSENPADDDEPEREKS
jgi:RNA polymerase-binding transcription factor